jgi:hypothetical protein
MRLVRAILQRAVRVTDHQRVQPGSRHNGEVFTIDLPEVESGEILLVRSRSLR